MAFNRRRAFGKKGTARPPAAGNMQPVQPIPIVDGGPPPARSGGRLGAVAHNPSVSTGMHFGHHKAASPQPAEQAGLAAQFNRVHQEILQSRSSGPLTMAGNLLTYFPPIECFQSNSMDIYASNGNPPPPAGNPRTANVNILISGVFPEGTRNRGQQSEDYTHIILVDFQIEVHDGYTGATQVIGNAGDILRIPSGVANYWQVIFVFVTQLPGIGRKKVILADRRGAVGDFTKIL
jgi:hypothetical protein